MTWFSQNTDFADRPSRDGTPKHWDSIARRYVEHDTTAQETFGPFVIGVDMGAPEGDKTVYWKPAANDNGIDSLLGVPGFIYLGSPYSKYRLGHDAAAYEVSYAAALLMRRGLVIYAPITHGHAISKHASLPATWDFWKAQCQPMIDAASALIVLKMNGWRDSVGLTYEIGEFERNGRPIVYVEQAELTAEVRAAA